jgi:hypothetical protein
MPANPARRPGRRRRSFGRESSGEGNWFITGAASKSWDDNDLDALKTVPGHAFAVVQAGRVNTTC